MNIPSFTMTNESITIVWKGQPFTVQASSPNFKGLHEALANRDWDSVPRYLTVKKAVSTWSEGEFTIQNGSVRYQGESVPVAVSKRLMSMIQRGEDAKPLCRFFERLSRNPSRRSVEQLFKFLQHCNIPLTEDGCFLAYKGVTPELRDLHTREWDNSPGATNKMPRNRISDDPREACHEGFHVGALKYANNFGSRVVICKVDPENVVSVPYDSNAEKMRVCEYEVVGHHGTSLPSTTIPSRDVPMADRRVVTKATPKGRPGKVTKSKSVKPGVKITGTERKRFYRFNKKDVEGLMKQSLNDLRRYARHHLKIVGASKIRGGKTALVATICKVRDGC